MTVDEATADWTDGASSDGYVMDLFCGTGTIGQLLARASNRKIIGVDIVEQAILDARRSAQKTASQTLSFTLRT